MTQRSPEKLSQEQEELVQAYILCHGNQSEAYRKTRDTSSMTIKSVWEGASKAFRPAKVRARIQELQDLATERHLVTVASITEELDENRAISKEEGQGAAMTASTVAKAKLHGLMIDKKEVKIDAVGEFLKAIKPTTGLPGDRGK